MSNRTTSRIVGVLFIVASATAIAGGALLLPIDEPDFLTEVAARETQIVTGVVLELMLVAAVVAIAVLMYPILRRQDEAGALGYVGARTLEGGLLLAAAVSGLIVLSLSQEYVASGLEGVQALGDAILAVREWTYLLGSMVALGVGALILNGLLLRSRLVPAWMSVWGLAGGGLILVRGLVEAYGVEVSGVAQGLLAAPIALQEMVLAVWLIVRGFDTSRLGPEAPGLPGSADRDTLVKSRA
jgi:hypothetical protein